MIKYKHEHILNINAQISGKLSQYGKESMVSDSCTPVCGQQLISGGPFVS